MILLHFDLDDLGNAKTVKEVYNAIGIGSTDEYEVRWDDQEVFGSRSYVMNLFCNDKLYQYVSSLFDGARLVGADGDDILMQNQDAARIFEWANYSPVSTGPRYEEMLKLLREVTPYTDLPENVIAIITPEDEMYIDAPDLSWQE